MAGPNRPSFPAPSEPSIRRLGVGGGGGGDRPLRAQLVVALVAGFVLIAVPLYLWRRPSAQSGAAADAPSGSSSAAALVHTADDGGADANSLDDRLKLAEPQRVKCSASPGTKGQEGALCDKLDTLEAALAKAIRENMDCAPKTGKEGSINFVLRVDFTRRELHVFPGASGSWKGPQARRATQCVKRALPAPQWEKIQHQYRYYMIAILATYRPPSAIQGPAGTPLFE